MTDEKNRELSEKELEQAAGGGDPYRNTSGQGMGKGSGGQQASGGGVGDAASGTFGTPSEDLGDASDGKSKK